MKVKFSFLAFFAIITLLFTTMLLTGCDLFNDDDDNNGYETKTSVEPLLKTKWGQGTPYNSMYPVNGDGDHPPTNCVMTAVAQIMKYYNHPKQGSGQSEPFTYNGVAYPSVNLNVNYEWGNMLNTYTNSATMQQRNAVATLMYHVRSGLRPGIDIHEAMTTYFGYDRSIQKLYRRYYNDTEWEAIIREQLDSNLPIAYSGNGSASHEFVIDGYDNNGKFHINWGWNGSNDGWYSLNALNPGNYDFNDNNDMFINIKPDKGGTPTPYEFALNSFTVSKTSVQQNELFTVTSQTRNLSTFDIFPGGQYGAALVDNNDKVVIVIGSTTASERRPQTNSATFTLNCYVPGLIQPKQYKLKMVARPVDGEWKIITRSAVRENVPNVINFTITAGSAALEGGYGLGLMNFSSSITTISKNEAFTVNYRFRNMGSEQFTGGESGAALVNDNGIIIAFAGTISAGSHSAGSNGSQRELNCKIPDEVSQGQYQLRIIVRTTGNEWRIATDSYQGSPTSIDFTVQ